ncbi:MAG: alpha/beta hydrolase [Deltaproteobacteria bacterium]|nr:alpha/beta hydrolase [Deltaproteobacteria bacterium]
MWQNRPMDTGGGSVPARSRRNMALPFLLALCALLAVFLPLFVSGDFYFFQATREVGWNPSQDKIPFREIRFESEDGVPLQGWLLCPRKGPPRGTILFLHGNAENIGTHTRSVLWLVKAGYEVFTFDYRGYGRSGGKPDIPGVHRDARAAVAKLLSLPGASADRYVVFGQSLGGAVAVETVAATPPPKRPRALIVDSAFAGYRRIVRDMVKGYPGGWLVGWPASWLLHDEYSPERWIAKAGPAPVVVIHGTADDLVPFEHGKRLHGLAKDPKGFWVDKGGHHIMALSGPAMRARFLAFLKSVIPPGRGGACSP